jgi:hypothetical protein
MMRGTLLQLPRSECGLSGASRRLLRMPYPVKLAVRSSTKKRPPSSYEKRTLNGEAQISDEPTLLQILTNVNIYLSYVFYASDL